MATLILIAPLWSAQPWWPMLIVTDYPVDLGEQFKFPDRRISPKHNPSSYPGPKIGSVENIRRHFGTTDLPKAAIHLLTKSIKTSTTKA